MRLSDLLGARVHDSDGADLGLVVDVRLVQDGPVVDGWGAMLRVQGLVVSRRVTGSNLGYDRSGVRGPWLVAAVVRRLHRDNRWVPWAEVGHTADGRVDLRVTGDSLGAVPALRD